jgi:hypothetical protein
MRLLVLQRRQARPVTARPELARAIAWAISRPICAQPGWQVRTGVQDEDDAGSSLLM